MRARLCTATVLEGYGRLQGAEPAAGKPVWFGEHGVTGLT